MILIYCIYPTKREIWTSSMPFNNYQSELNHHLNIMERNTEIISYYVQNFVWFLFIVDVWFRWNSRKFWDGLVVGRCLRALSRCCCVSKCRRLIRLPWPYSCSSLNQVDYVRNENIVERRRLPCIANLSPCETWW